MKEVVVVIGGGDPSPNNELVSAMFRSIHTDRKVSSISYVSTIPVDCISP